MMSVLVVDDETQLANNIADYLRSFNGEYVVTVAANGSGALQYIKDSMSRPSVLVTDLRTSGMSGLKFAAQALTGTSSSTSPGVSPTSRQSESRQTGAPHLQTRIQQRRCL